MEVSNTLRNKSADYRLHLPPLDEIHWPHQNRPHHLQSHALSLRALALFPLVYPRHLLYPSDIRTMVIHLKNKMIQTKMFEELHLYIYLYIYIYIYIFPLKKKVKRRQKGLGDEEGSVGL